MLLLSSILCNKTNQSLVCILDLDLDYCHIICSSASLKEKLQFAQNRAASFALSCTRGTNIALYLHLPLLAKCKTTHSIRILRNIIHTHYPQTWLFYYTGQICIIITREQAYIICKCNSQLPQKTVMCRAISPILSA